MSDEAGSPTAQRTPTPATPGAPPARPKPSLRLQLARAGMLVFVIAITLYVYSIRNQTEQLQRYGYSGLFLLSLLASATMVTGPYRFIQRSKRSYACRFSITAWPLNPAM